MTTANATAPELFAKTALNSWKITLDRLDKMFESVTDEGLQEEIAPGRNRIFYLLGHLVAVHDQMLPLLRLGARLHPELDEDFLSHPDRSQPDRVSAATLRRAWTEVNATLTRAMEALPADAWLERHNAISSDDFAREPLRNRLAVLLSRTAHVQFHTGQIRLAVKRS